MTSIKTILNQQYKTIQIEWLRYRNNPYDVQRAHDLRVSIRTLRGLIKFLKRQIPQVVYDSLNGDLSQSAKIFGPLRDLDVLMIQVGKFAYAHPEEETDYQGLFEGLYHQRNEEMQTTLTDTTQEALATYLMQVKAQLDTLNFKHETDWDKSIAREFKRRDHKLMKQYHQLDFHDYLHVHHVRKRAKTLRYSATYFSEFIPEKEGRILRKAKRVQDVCGTITDAHVIDGELRQLAAQTTDQDRQKLLLRIARSQRDIYMADKKTIIKDLDKAIS
ncbi:CHAD domain-containing protein [Lentilactobacillus hilgardii]|nr:CHAD domain-containing protein [Lentilactobacillus hilgardii]MCV3739938.1 CHAD domain-containing protein [Lentilactobacillus hilgardii]